MPLFGNLNAAGDCAAAFEITYSKLILVFYGL